MKEESLISRLTIGIEPQAIIDIDNATSGVTLPIVWLWVGALLSLPFFKRERNNNEKLS